SATCAKGRMARCGSPPTVARVAFSASPLLNRDQTAVGLPHSASQRALTASITLHCRIQVSAFRANDRAACHSPDTKLLYPPASDQCSEDVRRHQRRRRGPSLPISSWCHVLALRAAVEADRVTRAGGTPARLCRVLLAFRPPGEGPVRRFVRGRLGGGAPRLKRSRIYGADRHLDHRGQPARAVREILAASLGHGAGTAD